jgi:hypothetical protein
MFRLALSRAGGAPRAPPRVDFFFTTAAAGGPAMFRSRATAWACA